MRTTLTDAEYISPATQEAIKKAVARSGKKRWTLPTTDGVIKELMAFRRDPEGVAKGAPRSEEVCPQPPLEEGRSWYDLGLTGPWGYRIILISPPGEKPAIRVI